MQEFLARVLTRSEGILDQPESDGSHLIFNPANGRLSVVNVVGFHIWMLLDGRRTLAEVLRELHEEYERPELELEKDLRDFVQQLEKREFIRYKENRNGYTHSGPHASGEDS